MIIKHFYDEEDYSVVMRLLNGYPCKPEDIDRVRTRQLFLESIKPIDKSARK